MVAHCPQLFSFSPQKTSGVGLYEAAGKGEEQWYRGSCSQRSSHGDVGRWDRCECHSVHGESSTAVLGRCRWHLQWPELHLPLTTHSVQMPEEEIGMRGSNDSSSPFYHLSYSGCTHLHRINTILLSGRHIEAHLHKRYLSIIILMELQRNLIFASCALGHIAEWDLKNWLLPNVKREELSCEGAIGSSFQTKHHKANPSLR